MNRDETVPRWAHEEFANWADWCWSGEPPGPPRSTRAASAEGAYLAPSDLGDEPEPAPPMPDARRAAVVHYVYLHAMDPLQRRVLKALYVHQTPRWMAPARLRVSPGAIDAALRAATCSLALRMAGRKV